ncbi:MAG: hypothetical protein K6B67_05030 [Lachnospiraceae bacterium]|nr:hypothetical protein [Lachnospiraceae bacterium]
MNYIVKRIQEADFGCEERPAGYEPMVRVTLCDEAGTEKVLEVTDASLYAKDIDEGDKVYIDENGEITKLGI